MVLLTFLLFGTARVYRSSGQIGFAETLEQSARSQWMGLTFDCRSSILERSSTAISSERLDTDTKLACAFRLVTLFGSMVPLSLDCSMI